MRLGLLTLVEHLVRLHGPVLIGRSTLKSAKVRLWEGCSLSMLLQTYKHNSLIMVKIGMKIVETILGRTSSNKLRYPKGQLSCSKSYCLHRYSSSNNNESDPWSNAIPPVAREKRTRWWKHCRDYWSLLLIKQYRFNTLNRTHHLVDK